MQVKKTTVSETEIKLHIIADQAALDAIKDHTLDHLKDRVNLSGFRKGKAPLNLIEKNLDPNLLQTEFLEEAIGQLYTRAAQEEKIRPVDQPQVNVTKFVPFSTLEFEATVFVIGEVKLADYKKIKMQPAEVKISADDVNEIIKSLQLRAATFEDVDRAAKNDDRVIIDFAGTDSKGEPVQGAESKEYPLTLGSNSFIPGFEENVVGLKAGDEKTFTVTFPKDYSVKALANQKVTFAVKVHKVQSVKLPKVDDGFVAQIGPFKTVADLKTDVKKELGVERSREAARAFENDLVRAIAAKSTLAIPKPLVDDQIERLERDERQNLAYRGQTWQEHLDAEGITEEQHREQKRPEAEERVKASIILSEVAEAEKLDVTPEEFDAYLEMLKGQYQDEKMRAELDKPDNRRDIISRILTEKTLAKLVTYATKK